jgi:hypothetical protein
MTEFFNDSIDDLLGGTPSTEPKQLPQDAGFVRIREQGIGHVPAAQTFKVPCAKCHGTGSFRSYSGRTVGPCFTCKGKGFFERKQSAQQLATNRAKAADRKAASAQENWKSFAERFEAEAAWMLATFPRWDFAAKMVEAVQKYGDLTEGQLAAVRRGIVRDEERAAQKAAAAQVAQAPTSGTTYPAIRAFLQVGKDAGLKAPGLGYGRLAVSMAKDSSRNPGAIYVKWDGAYAGKIGTDGILRPMINDSELLAALAELEANPRKVACEKGRELGSCVICGLTLTDPVSIERGIGPICWSKWSF